MADEPVQADHATYHVRLANGERFGPVTLAQMCEWAREGRIPQSAVVESVDDSETASVMAFPELARILNAPPTVHAGMPIRAQQTDATGGLIPYKNPHALAGYYVSIGSLIPGIGLIAGPSAIILGIRGLRHHRTNPAVRGTAHAWIAIVLGSFGVLISVGLLLLIALRP